MDNSRSSFLPGVCCITLNRDHPMRILTPVLLLSLSAALLPAQEHVHTPGMTHPSDSASVRPPVSAGQAAYGAIAEVVRLLMADPSTDWSRVSVERLRQHLIDMDEVTLRSVVRQEDVAGGASFIVTGTGRTQEAIRRMTRAHGAAVGPELNLAVTVEDVDGGVRMTVLAAARTDKQAEMRIRALGFIGLMTTGDHHGPHHLAMAAGTMRGH